MKFKNSNQRKAVMAKLSNQVFPIDSLRKISVHQLGKTYKGNANKWEVSLEKSGSYGASERIGLFDTKKEALGKARKESKRSK